MTEERPTDSAGTGPGRDPERGPAGTDPAGATPAAGPSGGDAAVDAPAGVGRRSFVRAIAGESVTTVGKLAGISGMLMGSVVTAARAANDSFTALGGPGATAPPRPTVPATPLPVPAAPAAVAVTSLRLSEVDRTVLGSLQLGLLATNQPGAAPAVGVVRFLFDGEAFRFPGRSATARTANLQRDPFASLTLIDPDTGDALLLAGRTRIVYGAEGRQGAAEVLTACDVPLPEGWQTADARGDPVLVVLTPQRLFRRRVADERP